MNYLFVLWLLLSFNTHANPNPLDALAVNPVKAPVFFTTSIKASSKEELIDTLKAIDENLKYYPADSTKAFLIAEFYKTFFQLEKHSLENSTFSAINKQNLITAQKKLEQNISKLSKMSEFLLVEIFISYKNQLDSQEPSENSGLADINSLIGPWVGYFLNNTPESFNSLVSEVSTNYLKNLASISKIISLHSDKTAEPISLFTKLPELNTEDPTEALTEEKPSSNTVSLPEIAPTEGASEKIEELIEKEVENTDL